MLTPVLENALIERLTHGLPRSPLQLTTLQQADAEILTLPGAGDMHLAVTTDTIAEEIQVGLYTDPWLIGWMTVVASLSDLAAVGAAPLGILIAETLPAACPADVLRRLQEGIGDACRIHATPVLGGDTNSGEAMSLTGCALGVLNEGRLLTRLGCAPNDILFASGRLGSGNGFALARLSSRGIPCPPYRPAARLREGQTIRRYADACMDSSDGLLATLDQLLRVNGTGFRLAPGWEDALDTASRKLVQHVGVPEWFLLAGPHGEFELLFTIPPAAVDAFLDEAGSHGWTPIRLGQVLPDPEIRLATADGEDTLDTGAIRNLTAGLSSLPDYLEALYAIGAGSKRNGGGEFPPADRQAGLTDPANARTGEGGTP